MEQHNYVEKIVEHLETNINKPVGLLSPIVDVNDYEPSREDVENFENELAPQDKNAHDKHVEIPSGSSKMELVDSIIRISKSTGVQVKEEKSLRRMTKPELKRLLAHLLENGVSEITGNTDEKFAQESGLDYEEYEQVPTPSRPQSNNVQPVRPSLSIDVGAQALYNLNKVFSTVIEKVNENVLCDHTNISVEGFSDNLEGRKEELLPLFADIYRQHAGELNQYMSAPNMIMMINMQSLIASAHKQAEKN